MLQNPKKQSESVLQEIFYKIACYNILNMLQISIKTVQYFFSVMYGFYIKLYATAIFLNNSYL